MTKKGWLHLQFEVLQSGKTRTQNAYIAPGEFGKLPKGFTATSGTRYVKKDMAGVYHHTHDERNVNQWITKDSMVTLLAKKGNWMLVD